MGVILIDEYKADTQEIFKLLYIDKNYEKCIEITKKLFQKLKLNNNDNKDLFRYCYCILGSSYASLGNINMAMVSLKKAIQYVESITQYIDILQTMGYNYIKTNKKKARELYQKCINYYIGKDNNIENKERYLVAMVNINYIDKKVEEMIQIHNEYRLKFQSESSYINDYFCFIISNMLFEKGRLFEATQYENLIVNSEMKDKLDKYNKQLSLAK